MNMTCIAIHTEIFLIIKKPVLLRTLKGQCTVRTFPEDRTPFHKLK